MSSFLTPVPDSWKAQYGDGETSTLYFNVAIMRQNEQKIVEMLNRHGTILESIHQPDPNSMPPQPKEPNEPNTIQ
jgi:hypothetical protein